MVRTGGAGGSDQGLGEGEGSFGGEGKVREEANLRSLPLGIDTAQERVTEKARSQDNCDIRNHCMSTTCLTLYFTGEESERHRGSQQLLGKRAIQKPHIKTYS